MSVTIFTCKPEFEDMMTCIYDAWASRKGHDNVRLELEPIEQPKLFAEYQHVDRDEEKAQKVMTSVQKKISREAYRQIFYAAHGTDPERLDVIYRFLVMGFHYGRQVVNMLTLPPVMQVMKLSRKCTGEAHYFIEFARFTSVHGQVYVCHLEPKSDVILMVAEHFADRMPSEHWLIIDDHRRKAVIHPKNEAFYTKTLDTQEYAALCQTELLEDEFTALWRLYFENIAIEARRNQKCQMTMMPKWYRRHATEFME